MMRVLLIGGSGQLGAEIQRRWNDVQIDAPEHAALDAADRVSVERALDAARPDVLINCAAFHNVDLCEDEPERAFAVNAIAVGDMAATARARGIAFVTISTDYVFSGEASAPYTEDDVPGPISVYGTSKLAGEFLVRQRNADALIVRTCGIYGLRPSTIA